jgi:hypothetical protein
MGRAAFVIAALVTVCATGSVAAETKPEYQNRLKLMLDLAIRTNDHVRRHLSDKGLVGYAHAMAEKNASEAERMTPPKDYALVPPHFLLVLENIERSFYFASRGKMDRYRHHYKIVRRELDLLEAISSRERLELFVYDHYR